MTLTTEEMEALETTATLFNQLSKLDNHGKHPYDIPEAVFHVHSLQRIIMARAARRSFPETFNQVASPAPSNQIAHGTGCKKAPHLVRGEFSHAADDDGPFTHEGIQYCGRCHMPIEAKR